jgi:hypothetical protein
MPVLISTGQTTIYDQNDGKVVNFNFSVNRPATQIATKVDESTYSFSPDFTSANLVFTANVWVGGVNVAGTAALSSVVWTVDGNTIAVGTPSASTDNSFVGSTGAALSPTAGAAFGTVSSTILTIKANLLETTTPKLVKFAANYIDPITTTTTPIEIYANITSVANGASSVFLAVTGNDTIKTLTSSTTGAKNKLVLKADLTRAASIDDTGTTYRWSISPYTTGFYVDSGGISASSFDYKFSLLSTSAVGAAGAFPGGYLNNGSTSLSIGRYYTDATNGSVALSTTTADAFGDYKGLLINDLAIPDYLSIKCEAKDSKNLIYTTYFSVQDSTDPWDVKLETNNGGVLTNGSGTINIYPRVFNGSTYLTDSSNYTFSYEFKDKDGNPAFMIDTGTGKIPTATPGIITSNTTNTITLSTALSTLSSAVYTGDIIKCVSWDGTVVKYFEVAAPSTGTTVTIKTSGTPMFGSNVTTTIAANIFHSGANYGRMYICKAGLYRLAAAAANTAASAGNTFTVTLASATPLFPAVINGLNIGETVVLYSSAGTVTGGGVITLNAVHSSGTTISLKAGTGVSIGANILNDGWIGINNRHTYLTLKGGASLTTPQITLTGYDVDSKENITCYAYSSND